MFYIVAYHISLSAVALLRELPNTWYHFATQVQLYLGDILRCSTHRICSICFCATNAKHKSWHARTLLFVLFSYSPDKHVVLQLWGGTI